VKRTEHAVHLMRDYPNALRVRARSTHRRVPAAWAEGTGRVVVLLPGVYETWHFLQVLGDALNERGHPVHVVRALGFNRASIPQSARTVARELAYRDLRDIALVAHSKGGLIGKQLMSREDPERRVDRLVAVATPFGGSAMARLTVGRTMRAFLPDHPDIRALAEVLDSNTRVTSIYPRFDPNIPEGSRLEGATNIEIPVIGHFRVLAEPATVAAVIAAVEREDGARV
jgi:pimeloyl-ACP methyl ester carboxylesterase